MANTIIVTPDKMNDYEELNLFILYREIKNKKSLKKYLFTKVLLNKETRELFYKINISHSNMNLLNTSTSDEYVKLNIESIEQRFSNLNSIESIDNLIYSERDKNILEYLKKMPNIYLYSNKGLIDNTINKNSILLNVIVGDTPISTMFNYESVLGETNASLYLNETLPNLFYKQKSVLFKEIIEPMDLMKKEILEKEEVEFSLNIESYDVNETGLDDFIYSIASKIDSIYYYELTELKGDKSKIIDKFDIINKEIIEYVSLIKEKTINFGDICKRYIEEKDIEIIEEDNYMDVVTNNILKNYFEQEFYREKFGVEFKHLFDKEKEDVENSNTDFNINM